MLRGFLIFILIAIGWPGTAQDRQEELESKWAEGIQLYKLEKAAWLGSDLLKGLESQLSPQMMGYVAYSDGENTVCIYYDSSKTVQAAFRFDSAFTEANVKMDMAKRPMTELELRLAEARETGLGVWGLYPRYKNTKPNAIPIILDEFRMKVYVLTATNDPGTVLFGNDFEILLDKRRKYIEAINKLHQNLIPVTTTRENAEITETMHTHSGKTGDMITATDVCTLLLYCEKAGWKAHHVIGPRYGTYWNCEAKRPIMLKKGDWEMTYRPKKGKQAADK